MRRYIFILLVALSSTSFAQDAYWQQHLTYTIDVSLNDQDKTLKGFETIVYKNNSPSELDFIWFHIWPNAYKQESTALFQQIKNDTTNRTKLNGITYGSIEGLDFKVNGKTAVVEAHPNPQFIDVIK